jgi:hypothetical protein
LRRHGVDKMNNEFKQRIMVGYLQKFICVDVVTASAGDVAVQTVSFRAHFESLSWSIGLVSRPVSAVGLLYVIIFCALSHPVIKNFYVPICEFLIDVRGP